jgi:hypothetical protein
MGVGTLVLSHVPYRDNFVNCTWIIVPKKRGRFKGFDKKK